MQKLLTIQFFFFWPRKLEGFLKTRSSLDLSMAATALSMTSIKSWLVIGWFKIVLSNISCRFSNQTLFFSELFVLLRNLTRVLSVYYENIYKNLPVIRLILNIKQLLLLKYSSFIANLYYFIFFILIIFKFRTEKIYVSFFIKKKIIIYHECKAYKHLYQ